VIDLAAGPFMVEVRHPQGVSHYWTVGLIVRGKDGLFRMGWSDHLSSIQ
jgi:hypothetical protein